MAPQVKLFGNYPAISSPVFTTPKGTPFLKEPGVVMIGMPAVNLRGIRDFLLGFDEIDGSLQFFGYLGDSNLPPAEELCKFAGQLCYVSLGPKRTQNKDAGRYFEEIKKSGHGSVLEHAQFSFLLYGISRSQTHELVRHRAGCAYSQVSQRYVSDRVLRFVERPEYQSNSELHEQFLRRIDSLAEEYEAVAERLLILQSSGGQILSGEQKTDRRKKVQQCARSVLPNETEAPIVMSANVRALRHVISMRANEHAEVEIRELFFRVFLCMRVAAPILFADFEVVCLPDGTNAVKTPYPKV